MQPLTPEYNAAARAFWSPVCRIVCDLQSWLKMGLAENDEACDEYWGMSLSIPTDGYLEGPSGPVPFRYVMWIDISTLKIRGGMAGRPRELRDVQASIIARLDAMKVPWELVKGTWTVLHVVDNEPVDLIRIRNPLFTPKPTAGS